MRGLSVTCGAAPGLGFGLPKNIGSGRCVLSHDMNRAHDPSRPRSPRSTAFPVAHTLPPCPSLRHGACPCPEPRGSPAALGGGIPQQSGKSLHSDRPIPDILMPISVAPKGTLESLRCKQRKRSIPTVRSMLAIRSSASGLSRTPLRRPKGAGCPDRSRAARHLRRRRSRRAARRRTARWCRPLPLCSRAGWGRVGGGNVESRASIKASATQGEPIRILVPGGSPDGEPTRRIPYPWPPTDWPEDRLVT